MTTRIPTPQEIAATQAIDRRRLVSEGMASVARQLEASAVSPYAKLRSAPGVVAEVARACRTAGWLCVVEKGGARDGGITDALHVHPRCGECDGRGSVTVGPPGDDEQRPCPGCGGKGYRRDR